jgi:hypothetical protein
VHEDKHPITPLAHTSRELKGVVIAWPLDHAGKSRCFGEGKSPDWFVEIDSCGLAKTVNIVGAAVAEVDLVGVVLEDLVLRELPLQPKSHEELGLLAFPALIWLEPKAAGQLHRDGRGAFRRAAFSEVHVRRLDDSKQIEPLVAEETLVFGRNDRVDQNFGNFAESQQSAPLSISQRDVGDELWVELILGERGIVRQRKDLDDLVRREPEHGGFGLGDGVYHERVPLTLKPSDGILPRLREAGPAQVIHRFGGGGRRPQDQSFGIHEDARGVLKRALPQLLFDVASVTVLIEQEGAGATRDDNEHRDPRRAPAHPPLPTWSFGQIWILFDPLVAARWLRHIVI